MHNQNLDYFYLDTLSDEALKQILDLPAHELSTYINHLIERFYPEADEKQHFKLRQAYISSFILEEFYRENPSIYEGFTCLYTKTGLIKEVVNDLYDITPEKYTLN